MRIFVVGVIIRKGTLETDTIILRGRSLPLMLIRMSRLSVLRVMSGRRVGIGWVALGWWVWVLRLS